MKMKRIMHNGTIEFFSPNFASETALSVIGDVSCGFPSPADDFIEVKIDLNKELIKHADATYFGRVSGNSMKDVGIFDGDLLVIDRSLEPSNGKIAVCMLDGEFTCKRILIKKGEVYLVPENEEFKPIHVAEGSELLIWGIVTASIKKF